MNQILQFLFVLIGGDEAPLAYVFGIALSVIGGILMTTTDSLALLFLGLFLFFTGIVILFTKIRKDVKDVRDTNRNKDS